MLFNVKLNDLTILRLPPTLLVVWFKAGDDILDTVTDGVVHRIVWSARITLETFLLFLHKVIYLNILKVTRSTSSMRLHWQKNLEVKQEVVEALPVDD